MPPISAKQIRMARAHLDWTREDLAQASGLAVNTIRNLENGTISPRAAESLWRAFDRNDLEFIEADGIKRRQQEAKFYDCRDTGDILYKDIMSAAVSGQCSDVIAVVESQDMFSKIFSDSQEKLKRLDEFTQIRCLLTRQPNPLFDFQQIHFRELPAKQVVLSFCFVYANKWVVVYPPEGGEHFSLGICSVAGLARFIKAQFNALWTEALPCQPPRRTKTNS